VLPIAEVVAGKGSLGGETQYRRLVSWLGGYQALNSLLRVVEGRKKATGIQVSISTL